MEQTVDGLMNNYLNESFPNTTSCNFLNGTTTAPLARELNYQGQTFPWSFTVQMVLAVLGVIGNSLSLLVYHQVPGSSIHILLRFLAICDLGFVLILLHNGPVRYVRYVNSYGYQWFVAYVTSLLMWAFAAAATYTTIAIAAERLLAVAVPMKVHTICTKSRARIVAAEIIVTCLIGRLPNVVMSIVKEVQLPDGSLTYFVTRGPMYYRPVGVSLMLAMAILFDYLPPLLMLPLNLAILVLLRRQDSDRLKLTETAKEHQKSNADRRLTILLTILVFLSIVCNTPITLIRILPIPPAIAFQLQVISNSLYIFDHCTNFLLYVIINKEFRRGFFKLFKCGKAQRGLSRSTSTLCSSVLSVPRETCSVPDVLAEGASPTAGTNQI